MSTTFTLTLALPAGFRPQDILAFHRRDPQHTAERVGDAVLEKGLLWGTSAARLSLRFTPQQVHADLHVDGTAPDSDQALLAAMMGRMLGLSQQVEAFEQRHAQHPQLGALIARHPGLRVPVAATPFEALTWAITGQQISVAAAVSLRRKLILATGLRHSSGLHCYPGAEQIAALPPQALRQAGFSAAKTQTLQAVAHLVAEGAVPLDAWALRFPGEQAVREQLLAIRGIGPWTVNYTLLRGYGWLDGSLHGDAAVRRGLQTLWGRPDKVSQQEAENWLTPFSPWRALVGAHLWAAQSSTAY
ncbi:AlkA N-terminal domain-containing protein [Comamonas aquatica]|uniref:DNA-3-methyladenine glycosylase 2 n=1 Tax=Comamonas aquatica TaxID=225991 RepID=UPI0022DD7ED9|nr:AlkA N-terminal domain-containing protein [Comamonas aquatica]MDH1902221.1 3-methyladenine DNA glycosylase 2 [Comamonas aquatica]WBM40639.1 3-methyladenine DNA glycosylase 2 [Comamonas aquatica]